MTPQDGSSWFEEQFGSVRLMAIARGKGVARTLELAEAAWNLGVVAVEVTLQSDDDIQALRETVRAAHRHGGIVGAGTVTSAADVEAARAAGAAFTVSPGLDPDVVAASAAAGLPALPGVATASEVQQARALGLTWLKAFPARHLTPAWFTDIAGPFPEVRFVASGGITAASAAAFLDAGVHTVALGSALADPSQLPQLAALLG
ncbi:bifunctional 4-hydroxy-2-oxoglutarate aldolase/2-dehydro-3-deoxy-phosphogluconate aldolase [Microbacterium kribbense]|uniref:Bifunctional 4-hydroxy-2-oxoglutarate aldolase/2-dehydro-3-deoxy-phosphogluconate aldolase n=1 Tax=Microbacterium kribbense TaxID=433645 RepID=A0ABP7GL49_9MICO